MSYYMVLVLWSTIISAYSSIDSEQNGGTGYRLTVEVRLIRSRFNKPEIAVLPVAVLYTRSTPE